MEKTKGNIEERIKNV